MIRLRKQPKNLEERRILGLSILVYCILSLLYYMRSSDIGY